MNLAASLHHDRLGRRLLLGGSLSVALIAIGCSRQEPGLPVAGTVTYRGKPVPKAAITFYPASGRPVMASASESGQYSCRLEPGDYQATVVLGVQLPPGWKEGDPIPPPSVTLPANYSSRVRTPLRATVAAGQTEPIDFALK
ncbi:MAG: carboxypeptidase regulatory-like domain-containing protein [Pirellulales bacterium]|nr:carboxypeptidase regulatory-like domain-containing protein [Pirellulales bacterium]